MKNKKTIMIIFALLLISVLLSACADKRVTDENNEKYTELVADGKDTVTIPIAEISSKARFFNYNADGVTVQLVALRDKNDGVHIAFNTCQSCSPSPKAYYQQNGGVLQCTNCGFTFAPEEVGVTHGGCNPWPVDGVVIGEDVITIPVLSFEKMRPSFTSWAGPTK